MIDEALAAFSEWDAPAAPIALATVAGVRGSAPRPLGAKLLIAADGRMAGSVSGGCVEGAVVDEALAALRDGAVRLRRFGISDAQAIDVGLMCGGEIDVLIEPLGEAARPSLRRLSEASADRAAAARIVDLRRGTVGVVTGAWTLGEAVSAGAVAEARQALAAGESRLVGELLIDVVMPAPRAWIVGAGHIAEHVVAIARRAGFAPIVVDPRRLFAAQPRFADVEVLTDWPDRAFATRGLDIRDAVVVLSHDPKLDEPALAAALEAGVGYVGAIGSRRAHADRVERLRRAGVSDERIAAIHAPIGFDLGGREPGEIAVAIVAELVAARYGGRGARSEAPTLTVGAV